MNQSFIYDISTAIPFLHLHYAISALWTEVAAGELFTSQMRVHGTVHRMPPPFKRCMISHSLEAIEHSWLHK